MMYWLVESNGPVNSVTPTRKPPGNSEGIHKSIFVILETFPGSQGQIQMVIAV